MRYIFYVSDARCVSFSVNAPTFKAL